MSLSLAIIAFLGVAPLIKGFLQEAWCIHRVYSGENCDDAAEYLGRIRSLRAIPALVMVMKFHVEHMGPPGHRAAEAALVKIGKPAIPALAAALKDEDPDTRIHAASTLREMGSLAAGALEALAEALRDEEDGVSCIAAQTLGMIRSEASVPPLTEVMRNGHEYRRVGAAWTLGEMGHTARAAVPALIEALSDTYPELTLVAAEALGKIGPAARDAVPALIRTLDGELIEEGWCSRTSTVSLGQIGPAARAAVPTLRRALKARDEWVCAHAAEALGKIGKDAEPALEDLERMLVNPPERPPGADSSYQSPNIRPILLEAMRRIRGQ